MTAYFKGSIWIILLALPWTGHTESTTSTTPCPSFLNHDYRQLHSKETINLCDLSTPKALLLVNTASHCGFTKQFSGLEALNDKYADKGLVVIGFASNDFRQAAKNEAKAASICYENYGVSFTMIAPTSVRGKNANPTFRHLGESTKQPDWNFNKYLITDAGKTVTRFGKRIKPLGSELETAIQTAL